ncbi:MAG: ATP-binding protein [Planctomycetota bacterium]|nr:ATP-binding protein [Planctomycetota bacterium]MDA1210942.1 ATP-binding protein [Planctomycetota bacterium]
MIKSLRWRLQIWHAVILAVVLTLFGGYSYALQWQSRLQQVDAELDRTAGIVISRLRWGYRRVNDNNNRPDGNRNRRRPPELPGAASDERLEESVPVGTALTTVAMASVADDRSTNSTGESSETERPPGDRSSSGEAKSNETSANNDESRDNRRRGSGRSGRFGRNLRMEWRGISFPDDMLNPPDQEMTSPIYFAIWNSSGELLQRSQAAPELAYPRPELTESERDQRSAIIMRSARLLDGRREVVQTIGWGEFYHTIVVGRSLADEVVSQHRFLLLIVAAGLAILVVGMLGGGWLTSRAIQPLTNMSQTAASISATNLDARIDVLDTDTELGQLATVLNQTFDRLQAAFEQQVRFTADASHELRTPVSILLAQTQMALSKSRSDEDYREALDSCRRAALRMKSLTESLLSLARFDSVDAAEKSAVDVHRLIDDAVELLKPIAHEHDVTVTTNGMPCEVSGDAEQLSQLLMNLISNAIRYNRPHGRVKVDLTREDETAVITINDTGLGISSDDLPHVFERFYRIDKARTRAAGGSGLGLSIAKAIVQSHGGEITVDSEPDVGTTVTVKLPCGETA